MTPPEQLDLEPGVEVEEQEPEQGAEEPQNGDKLKELEDKLKAAEEKAEQAEKRRRDHEARMTQAAQEAAELKRQQEEAKKSRSYEEYEKELLGQFDEDPKAAFARMRREEYVGRKAFEDELLKRIDGLQAMTERRILEARPETGKYAEALEEMEGKSYTEQVAIMQRLVETMGEDTGKRATQAAMTVDGDSQVKHREKKQTRAERLAADPMVQRHKDKLGMTDLEDAAKWKEVMDSEQPPETVLKNLMGQEGAAS